MLNYWGGACAVTGLALPQACMAVTIELRGEADVQHALAAQDAGMDVIGYTSQGRFLFNCGLLDLAKDAGPRENAMMLKLVNEHEMGELFKVLAFAPPASSAGWQPIGFAAGDRTHRL